MSDYISFAHARAMLMLAMAEEFGVRLSTVESRYRREVAVTSRRTRSPFTEPALTAFPIPAKAEKEKPTMAEEENRLPETTETPQAADTQVLSKRTEREPTAGRTLIAHQRTLPTPENTGQKQTHALSRVRAGILLDARRAPETVSARRSLAPWRLISTSMELG